MCPSCNAKQVEMAHLNNGAVAFIPRSGFSLNAGVQGGRIEPDWSESAQRGRADALDQRTEW